MFIFCFPKMSYNYVVTAQKPTAVNACITGKYAVKLLFCFDKYIISTAHIHHLHASLTPAPELRQHWHRRASLDIFFRFVKAFTLQQQYELMTNAFIGCYICKRLLTLSCYIKAHIHNTSVSNMFGFNSESLSTLGIAT